MRALLTGIRALGGRDWIALAIEFGAVGLLFGGAYAASQLGAVIIALADRAVLP